MAVKWLSNAAEFIQITPTSEYQLRPLKNWTRPLHGSGGHITATSPGRPAHRLGRVETVCHGPQRQPYLFRSPGWHGQSHQTTQAPTLQTQPWAPGAGGLPGDTGTTLGAQISSDGTDESFPFKIAKAPGSVPYVISHLTDPPNPQVGPGLYAKRLLPGCDSGNSPSPTPSSHCQ